MRKTFNYVSATIFILSVIIAVLILLSDMAFKSSSALIIYALGVMLSSFFWLIGYGVEKIKNYFEQGKKDS